MRCVETSLLVSVIQDGPQGLTDMIQRYLVRYRAGVKDPATAATTKTWYQRSIRILSRYSTEDFTKQTLTYEDLSVMLKEMYDIYGSGGAGTTVGAEVNVLRREGYTVTKIFKNVGRTGAAAEVKALGLGEILDCGVNVTKKGVGAIDHAVTIGRRQDNTVYLYDPWPVKGSQMIELSDDLNEADHYFVNLRPPKKPAVAGPSHRLQIHPSGTAGIPERAASRPCGTRGARRRRGRRGSLGASPCGGRRRAPRQGRADDPRGEAAAAVAGVGRDVLDARRPRRRAASAPRTPTPVHSDAVGVDARIAIAAISGPSRSSCP